MTVKPIYPIDRDAYDEDDILDVTEGVEIWIGRWIVATIVVALALVGVLAVRRLL